MAFHGGLNAVLYDDMDAMIGEMEKVIPKMIVNGGYIIGTDHSIPDSVGIEQFRRFVAKAKELGGIDHNKVEATVPLSVVECKGGLRSPPYLIGKVSEHGARQIPKPEALPHSRRWRPPWSSAGAQPFMPCRNWANKGVG